MPRRHPLLLYLTRVLTHALKDWQPRLWAVILTIIALAVATWRQPPQSGAITLDWSKWKATAEAWAIVLIALFFIKMLCAPWKVHKEDQAQLLELKKTAITIHEATFFSGDGTNSTPVTGKLLAAARRDGLIITASSDALKCDPKPGDDHKYLTVKYSFGDEGPFTAKRSQDSGCPLVLPQDRFLLKQLYDHASAVSISRNAAQAHRVGELLVDVSASFSALDPSVESPLQVSGKKLEDWSAAEIQKDQFQQRYRLVKLLASATGLQIKKDNTMADPCWLYDYPSHFTRADLPSIN